MVYNFSMLLDHNVHNFFGELLCKLKQIRSWSHVILFFFLQILLNMLIYDNALYANVEDLNA